MKKQSMIKSMWLLVSVLMVVELVGQNRSFGTLPMVDKPKTARKTTGATSGSMEDSPKYQRALKVYNRLVEARGDYRYPVPAFIMSKEEGYVASMDYEKLSIDLEEKAYDVCAKFGDTTDAAIAFLLGHELSHYYEKHAWKRGFVADFKDLAIGMKLDSIQDNVKNETEADYLGGFLAYSAGFGFFNKGSEIIKSLYKAYGLPDKIKGYPSLQDRQVMGVRTTEKIKKLIQVFDMANMLTSIGSYAEAYQYYQYVLMEYHSREIYNNLGVTALLDAMQYFNPGELKYKYPVQLDLQSSAKGQGFATIRQKLINQAILQFDAAISLDPNYAPAYINKACAYALLGDNERAEFYGNKEARAIAEKNNDSKTKTDLDILMGILEATKGNNEKATKLFETAVAEGSACAAANLKIIKGEELGTEKASFSGLSKPEQIDKQNLKSLILDDKFSNLKSTQINNDIQFHQVANQGPGSFLCISQNEKTGGRIFFHCTNPGYKGETARKIMLGSDRAAIVTAYGEPQTTLETPVGQIMVYKAIMFILGKQNKLERWLIYQKEEG